jgi:hypothetical protein
VVRRCIVTMNRSHVHCQKHKYVFLTIGDAARRSHFGQCSPMIIAVFQDGPAIINLGIRLTMRLTASRSSYVRC